MNIRRFALGPLWTNGYLVWDGEGNAVMVDPGGDPSEVVSFIQKQGLDLKRVLLTHGHADHLFGLEAIRSLAREGVGVHEDDGDCLGNPEVNLSAWMGEGCSCSPAETLFRDGDRFSVGTMNFEVVHTPGHTEGGVCYLIREGEEVLLLSGDTLFAMSVGRTDLPGGDSAVLRLSLEKLAGLPDEVPVYPGHGPDTTIGTERGENPYWPRGEADAR